MLPFPGFFSVAYFSLVILDALSRKRRHKLSAFEQSNEHLVWEKMEQAKALPEPNNTLLLERRPARLKGRSMSVAGVGLVFPVPARRQRSLSGTSVIPGLSAERPVGLLAYLSR
ncbi:hypothetical protein [Spirosoma sp. KNUC1025]|uniref:hypothetical protein n=1 Tax=Spirosoma sp. KNUC1025 TaxID=2894082 RepID=UPI001E4D0968|nr:hypothetical protein [Spirosoma sp. KNUC1025]UFH57996.1 hypothetical protein LN737_32110 [Spirosoma sp. KNUC1025]